jgi:hypothetical protein
VGAAYGNAQFETLQPSAAFVSAAYLQLEVEGSGGGGGGGARGGGSRGGGGGPRGGGGGSAGIAERWRNFLVSAGASDGLSFVVSAAPLPMAQLSVPTGLCKNAKNVCMPYGLGTLTHKQPVQLTARFSAASTLLLRTACDASADGGGAASAFATLLARLTVDEAETPTASACPALAAAIRGDPPDEAAAAQPQQQQRGGRGGAIETMLSSRVPARCRGLYMPAGSPGAAGA